MICVSSSSIEDQSAFLQDRIDCLHSLSDDITTSNGVVISDKLRFFVGPTIGEGYTTMWEVQMWRMWCLRDNDGRPSSHPTNTQQITIAGKYGKQPGELKPFNHLRVQQIREEFHARGRFDTDKHKDNLEAVLKGTLKGVQRVPSLFLLNPSGRLSDLNL